MEAMTTMRWIGMVAMATSLTGCALSPRLDQQFGEAVNTTRVSQVLGADVSPASVPPAPLDGKAVNGIVDRYHRTFEQPPAATSGGVGAGGASFIPH